MEERVMMGLKRIFSIHWLMVRLNLSSDNIRDYKETTTFVKECEKVIECKKKEIYNGLLKNKFAYTNGNFSKK